MLEFYYRSQPCISQMRCGLLSEHLDGLAQEFHLKGYQFRTGQQILRVAGQLSIFAQSRGIENASQIDSILVEQFLKEKLAVEGKFKSAPNALRHMLDYLQRKGVIAPQGKDLPMDPDDGLLSRYNMHLRDVRGLTEITCKSYLLGARRLLQWFRNHHPSRSLSDLRGSDVLNFVTEAFSKRYGMAEKKYICTRTRSILRFLHWEGINEQDLQCVVPKIPYWRLAKIPRHLPWEQVRGLLDSIDTCSPEGKRDKAMLLLLATLGLRSQEIRLLQLSHINWRTAEIRLPRTKSLRERVLPLTNEVGEALTDYILNGRPKKGAPEVFLSHCTLHGPYLTASGINQIIKKRLDEAWIKAPSNGASMFRHSLATHLVNTGVPITEIANILGHASIDTTAIYTKVDVTHLAAVALPFWEGGAS